MDTSDSKINSSPEEKVVTVDSLLTSAQNINEKSESANEELGSVSISSERDLSHSISCLDDMGIPNSFQESTLFPNSNVVDSLSMLPAQNEYGGISAVDSEHQLAHSSVSDESVFQTESLTPSYSDVLDSDATSGVCGLYNLGNTCFMNAGLQCLFNNRTFIDFFVKNNVEEYCKDILTNEFATIMKKVWSGQYSILHLSDFKDAIGKSHPQFRDYRQHDCQEFLALLLDTMHEQLNISSKSIFAVKSTDNCIPPSVSTIDFVINNSKEVLLPAEDDACKSSNSSKQPCDCSSSYENAKYNRNSPVPSTYSMKDNISESMSLTQSNLIGTGDLRSSIHHSNPSIGNTLENASGSFSNQVCKHDNIPISSEANVEKIKDLEKMADLLINNRNVNKYMNKIEPGEGNTITPEYLSRYKLLSNVKKSQDLFPQNFSSENRLEKNELACKLNAARKIPNIEDFVKDTKTLNTNVLISEETNNLLKFGSEKFPNHEHHRLRETVNNLGKMLEFDTKQNSLKRTKVTNLVQEKKDMQESVSKEPAEAPLNVSKRIKIEGKKLVHEDSDVVNYEEQGTIGAEQIRDDYFEESSQSGEVSNLSGQISLLDEEFKAHNEWEKYKAENHSVIVHTFHGQLRSTVICAKCGHISITYEPFMYLPVPLPHALERQIVVTYVQSNHNAVRYLVNVKIHEKVQKMKEALQNLIEDTPQEIVLAEVLKNHISRFLDDNVLVRHVNDMTRTVYAFEVVQHLNLEETEKEITDMYTEDCTENTHLSSNCSNNFRLWEDSLPTQTVETPALSDFSKIASPMGNSIVNNCSSEAFREQDAQDKCTDAKKVSTSEQCEIIDSNFKERHIEDLPVNCTSQEAMDNIETVQWHTCAICLEDKPDFELQTHKQCQCILCHECIELSCLHYGSSKFNCPVCGVSIAPNEDFVPIGRLADYKFKISLIPIPLVVCHDLFENQRLKSRNIVGHPGLLKLPNSLSAATLYNCIDKSVPYVDTYSLLLVNGQGQSCSRCLYTKHCSGCEVARIGEVNLQPGDSLAIRYLELSEEDLEQATSVIDHKSMQGKRHKSILTLHDCLEAFRERESLDENSPWYCPVCCQNQQAVKSLCVCKFPDILIVYLKRFVFHEYASIKLDSKVCFPLEGLNLSHYVSGPCSDELVYDLQACVCHMGTISSGHYTAYAKHALSNEWFHFNDEIVSKQTPKTEDCVNEYILFYQKR